MSAIDFSQKMSFQRPYRKTESTSDKYLINREFESDRGRIINSAALRRLQQKTQVFPLERNAAVRSRLTHSLEVQQVGRHIVKTVIEQIDRQGKLQQYGMADYLAPIESVVEMACLLHDVGNPPFGHFGESAINRWFSSLLAPEFCLQERKKRDPCEIPPLKLSGSDASLDELRRKIRLDLCHFEGNAQSIRLVHSLQKLNLTYAQVACILKYTGPAYLWQQKPDAFSYLLKKPGYYLAEEPFIDELRRELHMQEYHRYPLTYIMEAADDISYCVADLEDAVEKEILTVDTLCQYLQRSWGAGVPGDLFSQIVLKAASSGQGGGLAERSADDQFFMSLRVNTIAHLVPYAARRFIDHLPEIFAGTFNHALLEDESEQCKLLHVFKEVAFRHVFNYADVELLELQGDRIISGLLEIYQPLLRMTTADFRLLAAERAPAGCKIETRLWHKLSVKQRLAYEQAIVELSKSVSETSNCWAAWEFYYRARLIQDYISGMTDHYAYDEYRRLMAAE
ncbi:MAG: dGTPase [Enterobacteriaceae bacterium]